jgi:transcriptional regulator with XRE-family HTH domain
MATLASRLRQLRRERLLTQQQLADTAGLGPNEVSRIESGKVKSPRFDTIRKLATALDMDPAELVKGLEEG